MLSVHFIWQQISCRELVSRSRGPIDAIDAFEVGNGSREPVGPVEAVEANNG